jgi:hypothetical protein
MSTAQDYFQRAAVRALGGSIPQARGFQPLAQGVCEVLPAAVPGLIVFHVWKEGLVARAAYNDMFGLTVHARSPEQFETEVRRVVHELEATVLNRRFDFVLFREVSTPWLGTQLARIRGFGGLAEGWLEPGSKAIRRSQRDAASRLAVGITEQFGQRTSSPAGPFFSANADGNIEFEWRVGDRELVCELTDAGHDLLALERGQEVFDGFVDQPKLFEWIGWLLSDSQQPLTLLI